MKTIVATLTAPRTIEYIEETLPPVGDDDMLIKMDAVGLCHSDLPGYYGSGIVGVSQYGYRQPGPAAYPAVVGHEAVATVLETGKNVKKFRVGDKVGGRVFKCFRTHMVVPNADNFSDTVMLFKLPDMKDKDYRCCLSEPLECVVNIVKSAAPEFSSNVAVIGCGVMGLLTIAGLRSSGAKRLVAIDVLSDKLEWAREMGATDCWNPSAIEKMDEYAYEKTDGRFFDIVIEVSGSLRGLDTALQIVKFSHQSGHLIRQFMGHGKVLLPSVYTREETFPIRLGFNLMARNPIMHNVHPPYSIDPLYNEVDGIEAFMDGSMPMDRMITHRVSFERLREGMEWLIDPPEGYIKGLCVFE